MHIYSSYEVCTGNTTNPLPTIKPYLKPDSPTRPNKLKYRYNTP